VDQSTPGVALWTSQHQHPALMLGTCSPYVFRQYHHTLPELIHHRAPIATIPRGAASRQSERTPPTGGQPSVEFYKSHRSQRLPHTASADYPYRAPWMSTTHSMQAQIHEPCLSDDLASRHPTPAMKIQGHTHRLPIFPPAVRQALPKIVGYKGHVPGLRETIALGHGSSLKVASSASMANTAYIGRLTSKIHSRGGSRGGIR